MDELIPEYGDEVLRSRGVGRDGVAAPFRKPLPASGALDPGTAGQVPPDLTRSACWPSAVDREVDPEPLGGPVALPGGAQSTEALDQQRVVDQRSGLVDEVVQHLVVASG